MEIDKIKKDTVDRIRAVRREHGLTINQIMEMLENKNHYISETTVKRVLSENYDPTSFKYRDTLAPLADVLLDLYSDKNSVEDIDALKAIIHDKNMTINILIARDDERKADYERRIAHLQKQIDKLDEHLMFRERVIERKDEVIERLLKKVIDEC